jgi:predicted transcriptional regulator
MVEAVEKLAKGAEIMAHSLVLMSNQVKELQAANEAASCRKSRKRKRIQAEGTLTAEEGVRLTTLKEFAARSDRKKVKKSACAKGSKLTQRRCGRCSEAGHNLRTCKKVEEIVSDE